MTTKQSNEQINNVSPVVKRQTLLVRAVHPGKWPFLPEYKHKPHSHHKPVHHHSNTSTPSPPTISPSHTLHTATPLKTTTASYPSPLLPLPPHSYRRDNSLPQGYLDSEARHNIHPQQPEFVDQTAVDSVLQEGEELGEGEGEGGGEGSKGFSGRVGQWMGGSDIVSGIFKAGWQCMRKRDCRRKAGTSIDFNVVTLSLICNLGS